MFVFAQAADNCRAAEEELDSVQAVNDTMFRYVRFRSPHTCLTVPVLQALHDLPCNRNQRVSLQRHCTLTSVMHVSCINNASTH